MINKRNLFNSVRMSLLQVVVSACTLFVLYKYLLASIGVDKLGIWALVLSTTSIARISDLGVTSSVVKFVSKYLALEEDNQASNVVQTAAISIGCLTGLIFLTTLPLINWGLGFFIGLNDLGYALEIVPYALFSLWISMIAGIFQSSLDGCQRIDLRNIISILGNILYLVLAVIFVNKNGLIGLAYAQIIQSCFLLLGSWSVLRRSLKTLPLIPHHFNRGIFKEIWRYSFSFQITALIGMLTDPLTKMLLSKFGDLGMVGYYDMASRMINQFRSLLVSVNRIIVPFIARFQEISPSEIRTAYTLSYRLVFYLSFPAYACLFTMIPIISEIWIGEYKHDFVATSMFVTGGMFLNSLVNPAYFVNLGKGSLSWNFYGFLVMAVMNILLGYLLGMLYGGVGVVAASVISFATGSWVILISFHMQHSIPFGEIFPAESMWLALGSLIGAAIGLFFYFQMVVYIQLKIVASASLLGFAGIVFFPMWCHPLRKRLVEWVFKTV